MPAEHLPGQMQHQQALGTCNSSGQDVRQSLLSPGVQGKASGRENKGAAPSLYVCLQVQSELVPWECRTNLIRGKRKTHIDTGDRVMLNLWTFLDFKYKEQDLISSKEVC